jgi:hypothetical protein
MEALTRRREPTIAVYMKINEKGCSTTSTPSKYYEFCIWSIRPNSAWTDKASNWTTAQPQRTRIGSGGLLDTLLVSLSGSSGRIPLRFIHGVPSPLRLWLRQGLDPFSCHSGFCSCPDVWYISRSLFFIVRSVAFSLSRFCKGV